ncbi:hypothetical protein QBA57_28545 [Streptomyces scabiei]|uniref:hypothetical protein n=1 Tax=Streptomyces scabiei TaxID=1930 RepID=UPI001B319345|nr:MULTISPECIES: hypothetical protein [Streptomyces]MBP5883182.1 hypothetical protein [Streptomyces sp. LBUM 1487]MDX2626822.1 hypothetical protein [Streptomyces scabiei]MDX3162759.1 hypothetical protein [Streptomyces scabiei]
MPSPYVYAGQIATADQWNAGITRLVTQENDQTVTSATTGTTLVNSEISVQLEPNALYEYKLYISYSADAAADFKWAWSLSGMLICSFSQANAAGLSAASVNDGGDVIFRRAAATTARIAGGSGAANFNSAYDFGTLQTDGAPGLITLQFAQNTSSANQTILRGGNQTRFLYKRTR